MRGRTLVEWVGESMTLVNLPATLALLVCFGTHVRAEAADGTTGDSEAKATYDSKFIWRRTGGASDSADPAGETAPEIEYVFRQGLEGKLLEGSDFYEAVGRPNLATEYIVNSTVNISLVTTGLLGAVSAGLYFVGVSYQFIADTPTRRTLATIGAGVGGASLVIALFWPTHPVTFSKRERLVEEHNRRLREELGVDGDYDPRGARPNGREARRVRLRLRFGSGSYGAGVSVGF